MLDGLGCGTLGERDSAVGSGRESDEASDAGCEELVFSATV